MQYYSLKSILASMKTNIEMAKPIQSFQVAEPSDKPYIEPEFEKIIYETERPNIIMISAVGATGKTALASQLSREIGLPVLDLGRHEPVGSHTLTGLLTTAFDVSQIGNVFQGLAEGTYGIIVDGIDEGRSKVTSKAFEAFLDDIAKLSAGARTTNFVLLGRTSILEDCWEYLSEKCDSVGLVTILPFGGDTARKYVDAFTAGQASPHAKQYEQARDFVLDKLQKAFSARAVEAGDEFLAFIGYPPVLDAIVTLLRREQNFHKLMSAINDGAHNDIEITLLLHVCNYILSRERDDKVIPNIVTPIVREMPTELVATALRDVFAPQEQLVRLVAHALSREITLSVFPDEKVNQKYEEQLLSWFYEHPFLEQGRFRNAVFEALALATLMGLHDDLSTSLVSEYVQTHKHSYHLIYMFDAVSNTNNFNIDHLHAMLRSAMEFRSVHSVVEIRIDGAEPICDEVEGEQQHEISVEVELKVGEEQNSAKEFVFSTKAGNRSIIQMGPKIGGMFANVPCDLSLGDGQEIELLAPCELAGATIRIDARELTLKSSPGKEDGGEIVLDACKVLSNVETIKSGGVALTIAVDDASGLTYPIVRHVTKRDVVTGDPEIAEKYFRLKRILQEFRSHSKGALAKYRHKIEHERVLKNEIGRSILDKLLDDSILSLRGNFYFLDPTALGERTGVTWMGLRRGEFPAELSSYLETI